MVDAWLLVGAGGWGWWGSGEELERVLPGREGEGTHKPTNLALVPVSLLWCLCQPAIGATKVSFGWMRGKFTRTVLVMRLACNPVLVILPAGDRAVVVTVNPMRSSCNNVLAVNVFNSVYARNNVLVVNVMKTVYARMRVICAGFTSNR